MAALIEWDTVGAIFAESLAAGIVVVGAFALGARLVAAGGTDGEAGAVSATRVARYTLAAVCFAVAAAAVAYGVYFTIDK